MLAEADPELVRDQGFSDGRHETPTPNHRFARTWLSDRTGHLEQVKIPAIVPNRRPVLQAFCRDQTKQRRWFNNR